MLVLDAHTSAPNLKLPTALTGFRITLIQHIADDHTITVHTHTSHARQRCGTRSVAAAINIAHSHGLLTSGCCDGTGGGCDWPDCPLRVSWKGQPE